MLLVITICMIHGYSVPPTVSGLPAKIENQTLGCVRAAINGDYVVTCDCDLDFHIKSDTDNHVTPVAIRSAMITKDYRISAARLGLINNQYTFGGACLQWSMRGSRLVIGGFTYRWYWDNEDAHSASSYTVPNLTAVSLPLLRMCQTPGLNQYEVSIRNSVLQHDSELASKYPIDAKVKLRTSPWGSGRKHANYCLAHLTDMTANVFIDEIGGVQSSAMAHYELRLDPKTGRPIGAYVRKATLRPPNQFFSGVRYAAITPSAYSIVTRDGELLTGRRDVTPEPGEELVIHLIPSAKRAPIRCVLQVGQDAYAFTEREYFRLGSNEPRTPHTIAIPALGQASTPYQYDRDACHKFAWQCARVVRGLPTVVQRQE
jgi:hypothetical protein